MNANILLAIVLCLLLGACRPSPIVSPPPPTLACETHTASLSLSASATTIIVGESVTITVTLDNQGCVALGMPQYRLGVVSGEGQSVFDPSEPEPLVHTLAVGPGEKDAAQFVLQAVASGRARLAASTSFEVHLGYPGPAYWAGASSGESLEVIVQP